MGKINLCNRYNHFRMINEFIYYILCFNVLYYSFEDSLDMENFSKY